MHQSNDWWIGEFESIHQSTNPPIHQSTNDWWIGEFELFAARLTDPRAQTENVFLTFDLARDLDLKC